MPTNINVGVQLFAVGTTDKQWLDKLITNLHNNWHHDSPVPEFKLEKAEYSDFYSVFNEEFELSYNAVLREEYHKLVENFIETELIEDLRLRHRDNLATWQTTLENKLLKIINAHPSVITSMAQQTISLFLVIRTIENYIAKYLSGNVRLIMEYSPNVILATKGLAISEVV